MPLMYQKEIEKRSTLLAVSHWCHSLSLVYKNDFEGERNKNEGHMKDVNGTSQEVNKSKATGVRPPASVNYLGIPLLEAPLPQVSL